MAGNRRWSAKEIDYVIKNYGRVPVADIAKKLKRSKDSVHWKANSLDVKFKRSELIDFARLVDTRFAEIEAKIDKILVKINSYEKK